MQDPLFWENTQRAKVKSQRLSFIKEQVHAWDALLEDTHTIEELSGEQGKDPSGDIETLYQDIHARFTKREFDALFTGAHDQSNAMVAIHAGTGGVDAMDWAEILLRMYLRFCESMGWRVKILDKLHGGEAGVKSVTFEVEGLYPYGYLKAENGVHRLVRISPFDAEGMRHTSFALVEVIPDLGAIVEIDIKPEDIRIDVFRASGKGGQGVNTTDSAVRITHTPTGIVVSCQNERSQAQNKETALRYLKAKLHRLSEMEKEEEKKQLRGSYSESSWGNQIRSYVLNPYRLVKDHRTGHETPDVDSVLDGKLMSFIESFLRGEKK